MECSDSLRRLCKYFCLCGVVGILFYLLHDIVGALNYPGYIWLSQAVSDLTATDAPSYVIASGLSSVYGLFSCICSLFLLLMSLLFLFFSVFSRSFLGLSVNCIIIFIKSAYIF